MNVEKYASFSSDGKGGNPAGVVIANELPDEDLMQKIATEVGFSETVFAAPVGEKWRVRYFSPEAEVPFCGHATIALGAALANRHGSSEFQLILNHIEISVRGLAQENQLSAVLTSTSTNSHRISQEILDEAIDIFNLSLDSISDELPPAMIYGGNRHLAITLNSKQDLSAMQYDIALGKVFMHKHDFVTVMFVFKVDESTYCSRNAFAYGGVYEDPATGSATAAYAGYLSKLGKLAEQGAQFHQGIEMGMPSLLHAALADKNLQTIDVSGTVRRI